MPRRIKTRRQSNYLESVRLQKGSRHVMNFGQGAGVLPNTTLPELFSGYDKTHLDRSESSYEKIPFLSKNTPLESASQILRREQTLRLNRRCATHARRCDRLTIDVIRTITRHKHARHIRRRAFRADDVAVLVCVDEWLEDLRVRHMTDGHEQSRAINHALSVRLEILHAHASDLVLLHVEDFRHR